MKIAPIEGEFKLDDLDDLDVAGSFCSGISTEMLCTLFGLALYRLYRDPVYIILFSEPWALDSTKRDASWPTNPFSGISSQEP